MKHSVTAAAAIALAFGLATAGAQAHGINQSMRGVHQRTAMTSQHARLTKQQVRQAQQALKQDGLYKGKIDGKVGPKTRHAIAAFQQQNGLRSTASLDQNTMSRLLNGQQQTTGVGSSMPNNNMRPSGMNNNLGGSGTSAPPAQMTPPPTNNPNANGGNAPTAPATGTPQH